MFLPRYNNQWLPDLEGERLSRTGLAEETADQIDAAAYAVNDLLQYDGRESVAREGFFMAGDTCACSPGVQHRPPRHFVSPPSNGETL